LNSSGTIALGTRRIALLGGGERLLDNVGDLHGLVLVEAVAVPNVVHLKFART
jgi:hypothetical protein